MYQTKQTMYKVQRAVCVKLDVSLKTPEKCLKISIKGNEAGIIIISKVHFESKVIIKQENSSVFVGLVQVQ